MIRDFRAWVAGLPPADGQIRVTTTADRTVILLDHPPSRNALSPAMMVALADAIAAAPPHPLILRGAEGSFCSGGNLEAVREHLGQPGSGAVFGGFMQAAARMLHHHPAPVIAVLEGAALGGGAELVAACTRVIAHPAARIGFVHARLGVIPGFGGGRWLSERVGAASAQQTLREARLLNAEEALSIGLVDALSPDPFAAAWTNPTPFSGVRSPLPPAPLPPLAPDVEAGLRRLHAAAALPEAEALAEELEIFQSLWGGPAHQAALRGRKG